MSPMIPILLWILIEAVCFIWYKSKKQKFEQPTYHQVTNNSFLGTVLDKGRFGEYLVYDQLSAYEKDGARFLFNCYLPKGESETTELDAIMIHKSGIYVFESKNYSGWIFGNEKNRTWTQSLKGSKGSSRKEHFLNPIMQNRLHIKC